MTNPGFADAETALWTQFVTGWAARTPADYPGSLGFTPPAQAAWIRAAILWGDGRNAALGAYQKRWTGDLQVQVFAPLGQAGLCTRLCDQVVELIQDQRIPVSASEGGGVLRFSTPRVIVVGGGDQRWWQANVVAPFRRERWA